MKILENIVEVVVEFSKLKRMYLRYFEVLFGMIFRGQQDV